MIAAPPQSPAGKISVMVVEDQPQILKNQLKILKAFPEIDVIATALSGEAALELLEERQPDVILQDLGLPRMTGIEVTRAVKGDPELRAIPILILSALKSDKEMEELRRLGAEAFASKPYDGKALTAQIRALLA